MYAQVSFIPSGLIAFVPIHWIKGFSDYHVIDPNKEYVCFYSKNAIAKPNFDLDISYKFNPQQNRVYKAHILNVYGNKKSDDCKKSYDSPVCQTVKIKQDIIQAIEIATNNDLSETRINALKTIAQILINYFLPYLTEDYKIQIINIIEKSLINGGTSEKCLATQLVPLLMLRMDGAEDIATALGPVLLRIAKNKIESHLIRAKCCSALSLMHFLSDINNKDLIVLMKQQQAIFIEEYQNLHYGIFSTGRTSSDNINELLCAALSAWGLLLTLLPGRTFWSLYNHKKFELPISYIVNMLESSFIDVQRIATEVLVLLLECGRSYYPNFLEEHLPTMINNTKRLATHHHHNTHEHRKTFKDILLYMEENISPNISVHFGNEHMRFNTWASNHQYSALCSIVGPTMTTHLIENKFLRDILQLGGKNVHVVDEKMKSQCGEWKKQMPSEVLRPNRIPKVLPKSERKVSFAI